MVVLSPLTYISFFFRSEKSLSDITEHLKRESSTLSEKLAHYQRQLIQTKNDFIRRQAMAKTQRDGQEMKLSLLKGSISKIRQQVDEVGCSPLYTLLWKADNPVLYQAQKP